MSYVPRRGSEFKDYALNFSGLTTANPATYGLTAADALQIKAAADDFAAKFELATNPQTRTKAAIVRKDEARDLLVSILRGYAMLIKRNRAVDNADKVELGLVLDDGLRTPVVPPTTRPQITISGVDARQHELSFADILTPESRLKPPGVVGLQLFCHVGDAPPADPAGSRFQTLVTRQPYQVTFQPSDVGKTAYYSARWYIHKGLCGPWSQQASMTVAG